MIAARMSKLIYITNTSLDGYIEDEKGDFDWLNPDQVFDVITELLRPVGTHLLGQRLYETMAHWGAPIDSYPSEQREFTRVWQKAEKIVYSRKLTELATPNTRIENDFHVGAVKKLKQESERDIVIGGADLARLALEAGLIDECHLFVNPVVIGHGKPAFRTDGRLNLELLATRPFSTGVVHVHYRVR